MWTGTRLAYVRPCCVVHEHKLILESYAFHAFLNRKTFSSYSRICQLIWTNVGICVRCVRLNIMQPEFHFMMDLNWAICKWNTRESRPYMQLIEINIGSPDPPKINLTARALYRDPTAVDPVAAWRRVRWCFVHADSSRCTLHASRCWGSVCAARWRCDTTLLSHLGTARSKLSSAVLPSLAAGWQSAGPLTLWSVDLYDNRFMSFSDWQR